jgi:predicted acyl esterase
MPHGPRRPCLFALIAALAGPALSPARAQERAPAPAPAIPAAPTAPTAQLALVSQPPPAPTQTREEPPSLESYLRLHYTRQEHMVPMRDGVKLFTSIYLPRDTTRKYPLLMKRTPYSVAPYGVDNYPKALGPSEHFPKAGYIFVNQDVRAGHAPRGAQTEAGRRR